MEREEELRLIRNARRGDARAIEALVRRHQASLYAFLLRRCRRPELAEDLVQESFVRVLRSLDRFDPRFRFSTWLFTIGRRLLVNSLEKMHPTADSDLVEQRGGPRDDPAAPLMRRERRHAVLEVLDHALAVLNPRQRRIVRLFHEEGRAIPEIAGELGIPTGTVKSHLHRARRRMQEAIEADGPRHKAALEAIEGGGETHA